MSREPFFNRSWVEIDIGQIRKNYRIYKNALSEEALIIPVVKANAYGHGDIEVCRALSREGADFFAVSNINEAVSLRKGNIKGEILVLGYTAPSLLRYLKKYDITQTVVSEKHAEELIKNAKRGTKFHIALDMGMKRIGFSTENAEKCIHNIKNTAEKLKITGIFTHFPSADSDASSDVEFTEKAIDRFDNICSGLVGLGIPLFHCFNSAGGLGYLSKNASSVRLGISLYGYAPSSALKLPRGIEAALAWKSAVCSVRWVKCGESIGYGRSFFAEKDMKIATLMTGYADGYPRVASNRGFVLIGGKKCRIVGRVCMDMMMVDVSECENAGAGDTAVLIGKSGEETVTATDIAEFADTISYEILTGISARVERIYL